MTVIFMDPVKIIDFLKHYFGKENIPTKTFSQQTWLDLNIDSLALTFMICSIEKEFNITVDMKTALECPNIGAFVFCIINSKKTYPNITDTLSSTIDTYPLTPQQIAIYVASIKSKNPCLYNIPLRIALPQNINYQKLRDGLSSLIAHHPELCVKVDTSHIVQPQMISYDFPIAVQELGDTEISSFFHPFNLSQGPLARFGLTNNYLLIDIHHILVDGRSIYLLMKELNAFLLGTPYSFSQISYSNYAKKLYDDRSNNNFQEANSYFQTVLAHGNSVRLLDFNNKQHLPGLSLFFNHVINKSLLQTIKSSFELSNTMLYFLVFCIVLIRYSHQDHLLSSITLMNRSGIFMNTIGMFVNTLPICIPSTDNLLQFIQEIKSSILNLFKYQNTPLYDALHNSNITSNQINTSFIYQGSGYYTFEINGSFCKNEWVELNSSKFDLTFEITETNTGYLLRIEYSPDLVSFETINLMQKSYRRIFNQLLTCKKVSEIEIFPTTPKQVYCSVPTQIHSLKCVHQLYSEFARGNHKTALIFRNMTFSYDQLEQYSNSLAAFLQNQYSVKSGDIVPIITNRCWEIIPAILAVMKIGAAYLLIDYTCPLLRKKQILDDINVKIILMKDASIPTEYNYLNLSDTSIWSYNKAPIIATNPDFLCYVVYTSGTTGKPKGIKISHRNLSNYCSSKTGSIFSKCFSNSIKSIVSVTNYAFDIFITESVFALLHQIVIYMTSDEEVNNPIALSNLVKQHHIESIQTTPSKMLLYCGNHENLSFLSCFKAIILGGEPFNTSLLKLIRSHSEAKVFNVYGPAETTVWVTCKELSNHEDISKISIGKPLYGTDIFIVSPENEICPFGIPGEICIEGANVGEGYIGTNFDSKSSFEMLSTVPKRTIYHTGDIGYIDTSGDIFFLGRNDSQIKLNGQRVELKEIEQCLCSISPITNAVVIVKEHLGKQILIAYYVSQTVLNSNFLKRTLQKKLMNYMLPSYYIHLDSLPLSANGKLDINSLPDCLSLSSNNSRSIARSEIVHDLHSIVYQIVCNCIKVNELNTDENIFDKGADSLSLFDLVASLSSVGLFIDIQSILDHPSVNGIISTLQNKFSKPIFTATPNQKYDFLLKNQVGGTVSIPIKSILITGVTGFLGAHILYELIHSSVQRIFCIVRPLENICAEIRLLNILQYYFPHSNFTAIPEKITILTGDITNYNLINILPSHVDFVIHCAATVNHFGSFGSYQSINIDSTKRLLHYAKQVDAVFVYISSISISGNSSLRFSNSDLPPFDETCFANGQMLDNNYVLSKYYCEKAILDSIQDGCKVKIIRIGNLTNRYNDLCFQPNYQTNAFLCRLRAMTELHYIPESWLNKTIDFSPVDEVSKAIVKICFHYEPDFYIYHVFPNPSITYNQLIDVLSSFSISVIPVPMNTFKEKLFNGFSNRKGKLIKYFVGIMDSDGNFQISNAITVSNKRTLQFLKKIQYKWSLLDEQYLADYISYFKKLNLF